MIDTRLVVNSFATSRARGAREQRDRDDEHPRRLHRGATRRCGSSIFKSSTHWYGCRAGRPGLLHRGDEPRQHPPRTALERDIVEAEAAVAEFAASDPEVTVTILRCANVLGPDVDTRFTRMFCAAGGADDPRLRPAAPVRPRGRRRARARARRLQRPRRASSTSPPTACSRSPRSSPARQAPALPILPPWGHRAGAASRCGGSGFRMPDEMVNQLRFGRGVDNRLLKATGFAYGYTSREAVLSLGEHMRLAPGAARAPSRSRTGTSARSRSSCAGARTCGASGPAQGAGDAGLFDPSRRWRPRSRGRHINVDNSSWSEPCRVPRGICRVHRSA